MSRRRTGTAREAAPRPSNPPPDIGPDHLDRFAPETAAAYVGSVQDPEFLIPTEAPDPFDALFAGADEGRVKVYLVRLQPETWLDPQTGQRVTLKGFLEELPPGLDNYDQYIKEKYGGGKYQATRKIDQLFEKAITKEISGRPRIPQDETETLNALPAQAGAVRIKDETVKGINIGGTASEFEERLMRAAMIAKAFGEPAAPAPTPDINAALLAYVLNEKKQDADPLNSITKLLELQQRLQDALPKAEGQDGLTDLLTAAVQTVGQWIAATNATGPAQNGKRLLTAQPDARRLPAGPGLNNATQEGSPEMNKPTEPKAIAALAVDQLVRVYMADPETLPRDVVELLDNMVPMPRDQRAALRPFKNLLFTSAKAQLGPLWADLEDPTEERARFQRYFDQVFELFLQPATGEGGN